MTDVGTRLRSQAMLGTDRVTESVTTDGALGELFREIDVQCGSTAEGRASALLSKLGAAAVHRSAGVRLRSQGALPSPSPPDPRPVISPRAAKQLDKLLHDGDYHPLLGDWLRAAADLGVRPPHAAWPALLEAATKDSALRPLVAPLLGERGRWLARQRPEFVSWAIEQPRTPDASNLDDVTHADRLGLFRIWRTHAPDAARGWIESALANERAKQRTGLLSTLEVGLGPNDEPLLESQLDDRSKDVRAEAARLLSRIGSSRLVARMEARCLTCVLWYAADDTTEIHIALPTAPDAAALRDGVSDMRWGGGKRAGWLRQMLACVPPSRWSARWETSARNIISAATRTDWADMLIAAWADAADRHGDESWSEALLELHPVHEPNLWRWVPVSRAEPVLGRWLRREAQSGDLFRTLCEVVRVRPPAGSTWSPKFSRAVATNIRTLLERTNDIPRRELAGVLRACAYRMDPSAHEAITDILLRSADQSEWTPMLQHTVEIVGFRARMLHTLSDGGRR